VFEHLTSNCLTIGTPYLSDFIGACHHLKRSNWMKDEKEVVNKVDSELVRNRMEILLS
jgi:hypothetical protein